jgi:hypothetical protein
MLNSKIENPEFLEDRLNSLIDFLDDISNRDSDACVSAGDVFGYLCGYMGEDPKAEDEIDYQELG